MSYTLDDRTDRVWDDTGVLIPQNDIDDPYTIKWAAWLSAGGQYSSIITSAAEIALTKLAFRRRFTQPERIAIDNAPDNAALPYEVRAAIKSMSKDLELADEIDLTDSELATGIQFLVQVGLLTSGRAAEILAVA